jgi:NAD(P)H-hydrate repair Nnr-like enzyme with NAD(P)H-hydrate dehydratase domain
MAAALRLAAWINGVVLLKGDRTIVATPSGQVWANPTGTSALATAGSGDVLAGLLGSLLAGGLAPERAAVLAAYVHGLAGRRAALDGPVTAPDVAAALRGVIRDTVGPDTAQ